MRPDNPHQATVNRAGASLLATLCACIVVGVLWGPNDRNLVFLIPLSIQIARVWYAVEARDRWSRLGWWYR